MKNKMKRFAALALAGLMAFALCACAPASEDETLR